MSEQEQNEAKAIFVAFADEIMGIEYAQKAFTGQIGTQQFGNDLHTRLFLTKLALKLWRIAGFIAAIRAVIQCVLGIYQVG